MSEPSRPNAGADDTDQGILQVVGFRVADEDFAVDILEIVPLVKLRTRFGFPEAAHDEKARVLVVEIGDETVGFIVDAVSAVRRFSRGQMEAAPPLALTDESRFVRGVLRAGREMLVLLDPFSLLREEEKRLLRTAVDGTDREAVA